MSNTILLVDNSYNAFYRINATMTWFKFSHPEIEIDENFTWEENEDFLNKLDKMYLSSLDKIIKNHHIENKNIYFCMDCSRKEIWRIDLYEDYKKNRSSNKNLSGIFKYIYSNIIPRLVSEKKISIISYNKAEADDIIAVIKNNIREKFPENDVVIITSDHDYLQLIDEKTYIYTLQNKLLNKKSCGDPQKDLFIKIVMGDNSDNIPKIIPKCGYKTALKYSSDIELFEKKVLSNTDYQKKFLLNQKLIDFSFIPEEIKTGIINRYESINI